jgi:hypothetical protein
MLVDTVPVERFELFGLPEDHTFPLLSMASTQKVWRGLDRVETSRSPHEFAEHLQPAHLDGRPTVREDPDPCHELPITAPAALRYSAALTSIRSFYRLCDGLQTLALVDKNGFLIEIIDVEEWALPFAETELVVPSPTRYRTHSAATLCGGHICLILTPNGEMKVFANGLQVFRFWDGRWKLVDSERKYALWAEAVGNAELAERLQRPIWPGRRSGLLVVLDDPNNA